MSDAATVDARQAEAQRLAAQLRRFACFAITTPMKETMLGAAQFMEASAQPATGTPSATIGKGT